MIHFNFLCTSFGLNNPRKYSATLEAFLVVEREGAARGSSKNLVLYRNVTGLIRRFRLECRERENRESSSSAEQLKARISLNCVEAIPDLRNWVSVFSRGNRTFRKAAKL
jgi:hypothetical protein